MVIGFTLHNTFGGDDINRYRKKIRRFHKKSLNDNFDE